MFNVICVFFTDLYNVILYRSVIFFRATAELANGTLPTQGHCLKEQMVHCLKMTTWFSCNERLCKSILTTDNMLYEWSRVHLRLKCPINTCFTHTTADFMPNISKPILNRILDFILPFKMSKSHFEGCNKCIAFTHHNPLNTFQKVCSCSSTCGQRGADVFILWVYSTSKQLTHYWQNHSKRIIGL